uniref:ELMO domain-containing protein 1 n=1 Tax=Apis cerana TaxID=7461 RepID=V9IM88_APICE
MCELQRICYGELSGAPRTLAVEKSLKLSKNANIKTLLIYLNDLADQCAFTNQAKRKIVKEAIESVLVTKKINPAAHPDFSKSFGKCIELIWGYRQLCVECEELRRTPYDADNPDHELLLLKLLEFINAI